jgi:hypothetical protein
MQLEKNVQVFFVIMLELKYIKCMDLIVHFSFFQALKGKAKDFS